MRAELDDEQERRFWGLVLRTTGSVVLLVLLLGAASAMAILLDWSRHLLPCVLGLLAGAAVAAGAAGSPRSRQLTAVVLGTVTLPALAAHVAAVGAGSEEALSAYSARLIPFLANASAATLTGIAVAALWRRAPHRAVEATMPVDSPGEVAPSPTRPAVVELRDGRAPSPQHATTHGAVP